MLYRVSTFIFIYKMFGYIAYFIKANKDIKKKIVLKNIGLC